MLAGLIHLLQVYRYYAFMSPTAKKDMVIFRKGRSGDHAASVPLHTDGALHRMQGMPAEHGA